MGLECRLIRTSIQSLEIKPSACTRNRRAAVRRRYQTYIKVKGSWKYLYRAVGKQGKSIGFLLAAKREALAARRFFDKAMQYSEVSSTVTVDKSGANKAVLDQLKAERDVPIALRQVKYLNNIVEQDHRAIKRVIRPILGFKSFRAAQAVLAGIELMHVIRKGQFNMAGCDGMSFADQFYMLAGRVRPA
jgi:transposase-like protein